LWEAFGFFTDFTFLLFVLAGTLIGVVIGIIPAIGGLVGVAVLLPFLITLTPEQALPFIIALSAVTFTGGLITTVLVGVPGTGPNAATLVDGYALMQKGQGGRAIGAGLTASGMGGMLSGILALGFIPLVIPMILALRSGDMVFIILLGLAFIGVLGGKSIIRGVLSGGLGLLISFIGFQASTGLQRFTFGSLYLYDGIPLIPFTVGLFALPTMVELAISGGSLSKTIGTYRGMAELFEGVRDVFHHWRLWLRSSIVGYIIGVIPGVGAEVSTFVCYGQAKHLSKHPEEFGKGSIEGVIAPESGNNGKEGGSLITTLALGIPGSAMGALILTAIRFGGLTPGPQMLTEQLPLSISLVLVVIVSSLVATVICFPTAGWLVRIAYLPGALIIPVVLVIAIAGAYVSTEFFNNIVVALIFGAIGVAMIRFSFSRPAMLLGYVMGYIFERKFWLAYGTTGPTFFMTPISLSLLVLFFIILFLNPLRRLYGQWRGGGR
jgi:TctA family transporter